MLLTFFISCFTFKPAPYQAPVIAVAVVPTVRMIVRALGALDMVLGELSITWYDVLAGEDEIPQSVLEWSLKGFTPRPVTQP